MVVVQPGGERRADLVDVGRDVVPRVRAAVVGHLRVDHQLRDRAHVDEIGQTGVGEVDEADSVEGLTHATPEFTVVVERACVEVDVAAVDRER